MGRPGPAQAAAMPGGKTALRPHAQSDRQSAPPHRSRALGQFALQHLNDRNRVDLHRRCTLATGVQRLVVVRRCLRHGRPPTRSDTRPKPSEDTDGGSTAGPQPAGMSTAQPIKRRGSKGRRVIAGPSFKAVGSDRYSRTVDRSKHCEPAWRAGVNLLRQLSYFPAQKSKGGARAPAGRIASQG